MTHIGFPHGVVMAIWRGFFMYPPHTNPRNFSAFYFYKNMGASSDVQLCGILLHFMATHGSGMTLEEDKGS